MSHKSFFCNHYNLLRIFLSSPNNSTSNLTCQDLDRNQQTSNSLCELSSESSTSAKSSSFWPEVDDWTIYKSGQKDFKLKYGKLV
ncbi:hypothetical protein BpHYR1_022842 [Brachionus plicatilis]|uniref:Uncharacterized protein n=1 Tax=Brachionus plicatilis TaxID=10195 RepID=A0A3M7Q1N5_BRAPC|nr:hypothetical protein BpHYR1_022842 [Brachionus plicatilis]